MLAGPARSLAGPAALANDLREAGVYFAGNVRCDLRGRRGSPWLGVANPVQRHLPSAREQLMRGLGVGWSQRPHN